MAKTLYKNRGTINIEVSRNFGGRGVGPRSCRIQTPFRLFRSSGWNDDKTTNVNRGYNRALESMLQLLKNGLHTSIFNSVNPMKIRFANTYGNRNWAGWNTLGAWTPRGQTAMLFNRYFHNSFSNLTPRQKESFGWTLGAIAAGIAFGRSTIAFKNNDDFGYVQSYQRKDPSKARKSRIVDELVLDRTNHNRIHLERKFATGEDGIFAQIKTLIHESSHAYAQTSDYYYVKERYLEEVAHQHRRGENIYSRSNLGDDLSGPALTAFTTHGTMSKKRLLGNADTIAFDALAAGKSWG